MKTILITGASKGIGYALVQKALNNHHRVIAISRSIDSLLNLKERFETLLFPLAIDLQKPESVQILGDFLKNSSFELDVIINNAGLLINKSFSELSDADWLNQFDVNVMGAVRIIRMSLPYIKANTHIVNIGSMGGFQGSQKFPGLSAYSSTKGALSILSECLSVEPELKNCTINSLCLGAVETEMLSKAFPNYKAPLNAEQMADFIFTFSLEQGIYLSGKILPISLSNPN